jgi:hypothetical protein
MSVTDAHVKTGFATGQADVRLFLTFACTEGGEKKLVSVNPIP